MPWFIIALSLNPSLVWRWVTVWVNQQINLFEVDLEEGLGKRPAVTNACIAEAKKCAVLPVPWLYSAHTHIPTDICFTLTESL